jgi:hypothetical protein
MTALLTIPDKCSRRLPLTPGYITASAAVLARHIIGRLETADWGVPQAIISGRDPKFTSDLSQEIFLQLSTSLLTSTAYRPQTDGQSERSNEAVEIAIRVYRK